jgi:hypothetical protein
VFKGVVRRRDLLAALALLAPAACRRRSPGRPIEGSIVGADHARGHRLLQQMTGVATRREHVQVAILGGGIAGLATAWALERAGVRDFVVLELEDAPGGTSRGGVNAVSAFPLGAHYVPVPVDDNPPLVALLAEVGALAGRTPDGRPVWAEEVLCRDPEERLFFRGSWYEGLYPRVGASPEDLRQLEALEKELQGWAVRRDGKGRRAFDLPRARGSQDEAVRALDGISMARWLDERGLTSERLRWLVEYGCRDDFGATLGQTSAWAGVHYFSSRLQADGEAVPVLTWPEGNARLVHHLATVCGARLRPGALVSHVAPAADRVTARYLDTRRGETVEIVAEHAVLAVPRYVVARVVEPWRAAPPAFLRETVYGAWLVANLTLRDRPRNRGFEMAWDSVLYAAEGLGYVCATHQSGRDRGATVLTYYRALLHDDPARSRRELLDTGWDGHVERVLADLRPAHPDLRDLVERVDVALWGHAMVRPRPGYAWSAALGAGAKPLGRLQFAHTDLSGMALVEEAIDWAVRAAATIAGNRAGRPDWLRLTEPHISMTMEA